MALSLRGARRLSECRFANGRLVEAGSEVEVTVFNKGLGDTDAVARALQGFAIVCLMRERTPFPRALIEKLPEPEAAGDDRRAQRLDRCRGRARIASVIVCGTDGCGHPTAELAVGLMIDLARKISFENARMKAGEAWQTTIGDRSVRQDARHSRPRQARRRVAKAGQAFGMKVHCLEPESDRGKMPGGGRRLCHQGGAAEAIGLSQHPSAAERPHARPASAPAISR